MPAIVMIAAGTNRGVGFVVDRDGLIAVSLHTIEGQASVRILHYEDKTEYPVTAVAGVDRTHDLALLRVDAKKLLPTAPLGDSSRAAAGQHLYALGSEGPFDGVITAVRPLTPQLTIFTIKTSNPNQWIGPLFNDRGEVVAIATAVIPQDGGLVIAVPTNYLQPLIQHPISISPAAVPAM